MPAQPLSRHIPTALLRDAIVAVLSGAQYVLVWSRKAMAATSGVS